MVRPRFAKLPPAQQQAILRAALDEFAAHGFHDASLNRVIEAAGISKGSMYYYFDGKEDLYAHVARVELEQLFARLGPFPVPATMTRTPSGRRLANYYLRLMTALDAVPQLAALIRGWIAASSEPGAAAGAAGDGAGGAALDRAVAGRRSARSARCGPTCRPAC